MLEQVWILGGLRSFIGVKDGIYRHVPAEMLGARILTEVIARYELPEDEIDLILGGNAVGGGGNITRLALLEAGIAPCVPALTLDLQCASALEAITAAAARIESGMADLVIAGGLESASTQPLRAWNQNHPLFEPSSFTVARFIPGRQGEQVMLEGAERAALEHEVTREEMDPWVLRSHRLAARARKEGSLADVCVSVAGSTQDEGIREHISQRLLDRLPFLLPNGSRITAGNACLMHDGAAFVILCSTRWLKRHGRTANVRLRLGDTVGGDPLQSPCAAPLAARRLLKKAGLSYSQIDAFEINEAFAVIDVLFARAFPGIEDRYNIFGSALAYGHPYGVSGAMILLHLMKALEEKDGRYGLCGVAAAGGVGSAILAERIS
ncbi:MAG: acetyl-CoA C-acyltransferase [Clostridiales bacterium]|nr:acetyl-CoA C-acyltransferase [Clostridiales bacterium]